MYLDNKYTKWYYNIIEAAKLRLPLTEDAENHHIIPESFFIHRTRKGPTGWLEGDPNSPKNKVKLTCREHILCHMLLVKMTTGLAKKKMVHGLWMMSRAKINRKRLTARQYAFARKEFCSVIKVSNSHPRRPLIDKEKILRSVKLKGKLKGIPKTQETKSNMKEAWKHRNRTIAESTCLLLKNSSTAYWANNKVRQEQSIKRKSYLEKNPDAVSTMIANINKIVTCQHCGKETNIGNHNRWQGNNCRLNTI
jgi:hypothetical protein